MVDTYINLGKDANLTEALSADTPDEAVPRNFISMYLEEDEKEIILKAKDSQGMIYKGTMYNGHTGISDKTIDNSILIPSDHVLIGKDLLLSAGSEIHIESNSELFIL